MTKLYYLDLDNNQVSDLDPLSGLINLQYIFLRNNLVSDLKALGDMTKLQSLALTITRSVTWILCQA
jgi:internalin A